MKKLSNYIAILIIALTGSCSIDNYAEPEETVYGEIIDVNTGKPIRTAIYDCMIQLEDLTWSDSPTPMTFSSKPDGTFVNTKVFRGKYRVTPVYGPFIPIEGKKIEIQGKTQVSFEVEPYLNVDIINLENTGTKVSVDFKVSSSNDLYKVTDAQFFAGYTNFVSNGSKIEEYRKEIDFSNVPNEEIYSQTHHMEIDNLKSDRSYYFRVGVRVDDPIAKKYNYSEVSEEILIP
ncbi:MAG: hypothetical protein PARBA_02503 [Parabacteroides sp.]